MELGDRNWLGNFQCFERNVQRPWCEQQLIDILTDSNRYPSPVRPMGSRHSMTECMVARRAGRWGTAVDMTGFTVLRNGKPLDVDVKQRTAVIPAGRIFIEVARELRDTYNLTFNVVTEIGALTIGAAACGATKDSSSTGGEFGQVCSGVIGMRLIQPDGTARDMRRGVDAEFEALCCSYGLFGIVTEVTFQLVRHALVSLRHETIPLDKFQKRTSQLLQEGNALFLYLFPYQNPPRIVAEVRRPASRSRESCDFFLWLRNRFWLKWLHRLVHVARRLPPVFGKLLNWGLRFFLVRLLRIKAVSPVSHVVDFREPSPKFAFSMWAFPSDKFPAILRAYFDFCRQVQLAGGFKTLLPQVSYHIGKDRSSLLSYSYDGDVWSLDPIASGDEPGWHQFLDEFNARCSALGGKPLFNQTPRLTPDQVEHAFGSRLKLFEQTRRAFDPGDRMLNDYFAGLMPSCKGMGAPPPSASSLVGDDRG
jgi:FAD/FMN-containing dehydrogenase